MLTIDVLTLFPEFFSSSLHCSILKRGIEKKKIAVQLYNIRDYSELRHKQVDDYAYGGEAGMVMMPEPLAKAIHDLNTKKVYDDIIFLTPDGEKFNQKMANHLSLKKNLLLLCGHYKGIDERIREKYITKEISIGDYVLTGGELPALVLMDSLCRLQPGVLNDETSALSDSFQDNLLSHPVYTRPRVFENMEVPEVLFSGNHKKIEAWKQEQATKRTQERRPDLLDN